MSEAYPPLSAPAAALPSAPPAVHTSDDRFESQPPQGFDRAAPRIDRAAAVLGCLTVVLGNWKYLAGLDEILDPVTSMEPYYIDMAARSIADIVSGDPAWGPLYALWLKAFRAVFADPLAVHAANVAALSLALSTAMYFLLLILTRRAALATVGALIFMISNLNVPLPSKVCSFAILLVLLGLTAGELVPRGSPRLAVTAVATLLASYARPEFYVAGLCMWAAALWQGRREPPVRRAWLAGGSVAIAMVAIGVGTPPWSPDYDGGRLFDAFREHFAWNWAHWNDGHAAFAAIWQQEFGAADGIVAAALANPSAVMRHVAANLAGALRFATNGVFAHPPLLAPADVPVLVQVENAALIMAALGAIAVVAFSASRRDRAALRYGHLAIPVAALALISIAAAILIFPAPHYLAPLGVLILIVAVLAISLPIDQVDVPIDAPPRWGRRAMAAALAIAVLPTPFVLPADSHAFGWRFAGDVTVARKLTDTVLQVRALGLPPPVHVLTFTDGIAEMMGAGYEEIKIWGLRGQTLEEYIRARHVDVIVTMERGRQSFHTDDVYWHVIETEPHKAGFTRLPTRDPRAVRVYVRTALLPEPNAEESPRYE